jgi:predicted small integral membrane protein
VILRLSKILLVAGIAFFHTLIVFNNATDYSSNFQYVQHVLAMDTTFRGNHGMWRAIHSQRMIYLFYDGIIVWEMVTTVLCWIGVVCMSRAWRKSIREFSQAKRFALIALTLSLLLWLVAFLAVGGEWFLMWQSALWNGQNAAARMFLVVGVVFLLLAMPDTETQP